MKLYYFPTSHWSRAVHLALRELELDYEPVTVDLTTNANFEPSYLALNPRAVVPTLEDGGELIWDARNIARHLDAHHAKGQLWRAQDALVQQWTAKLHDFPVMLFSYEVWIAGARGERSKQILADKITRARSYAQRYPEQRELYARKASFFEGFSAELEDAAHVAAEHRRWRATLEQLARLVDTREWIGGARWCFADCIAASVLARLVDLERIHDWYTSESHALRAYFERLRATPAFRHVFYDDPAISARLRLREPSPAPTATTS